MCASVFFRFLLWVVGSDLVCCRSVRYLVSSEQPTGRIFFFFFFFFLYLMPIGFLPFSTKTGWTGKKKNQIYDSISFFWCVQQQSAGNSIQNWGEAFRHLSDDHRRSRHFNNTSATMSCTKMKIQIKRLFTRFWGKCRWLESPGCWANIEKSIDGRFFLIPYKRMRRCPLSPLHPLPYKIRLQRITRWPPPSPILFWLLALFFSPWQTEFRMTAVSFSLSVWSVVYPWSKIGRTQMSTHDGRYRIFFSQKVRLITGWVGWPEIDL